jgi:SagB-type dehydrogenase family enzyme
MPLTINPALRLIPPSSVSGRSWTVDNLLARRRYQISDRVAALLAAACRPQEREHLAKTLDEITSDEGVDGWLGLIDELCRRDMLVDVRRLDTDTDFSWVTNLRRSWSRHGWHEAVEYHMLSFAYPCLDYEQQGAFAIDRARMRDYQRSEPDGNRYKLSYLDRPGIEIPAPTPTHATATARELWAGVVPPRQLTWQSLRELLSLGFAVTHERQTITNAAPLLHTTSPSGGARHPTEGYLAAVDVPGLPSGWYHVTRKPLSLRRVNDDVPTAADVRRVFPETALQYPDPIRAVLVLTSIFERNMYRYREPRTFRTVFMDAGHVAGTVGRVADSAGLSAGVYYCDHSAAVERALGLDGLEEGYMLTVALSDGVGAAANAEKDTA